MTKSPKPLPARAPKPPAVQHPQPRLSPVEAELETCIRARYPLISMLSWEDEIDKGFAGLQSSGVSDSGTTSRVFATLITWLQEKTEPVFVIATANNVEQLPPELMRQGRFDEIFFVDLPNETERGEIFKIHLAKRRRDPRKFDLKPLIEKSAGFSGAEIEQAVISALYDAFDENQDVTQEILIEAIENTKPLSKVMAEEIQARRQWAEGRTRSAS
jgi:SpoVK/Ycf46/Vps4 family AAA+-type ATPase